MKEECTKRRQKRENCGDSKQEVLGLMLLALKMEEGMSRRIHRASRN